LNDHAAILSWREDIKYAVEHAIDGHAAAGLAIVRGCSL
jgi:hypothetical protein